MPSDTSAPIRHAPIALWRVMQALLGALYTLFGAPEDVAREHTFATKAHAHLASWLRSAEALLRRLLLIEASVYPKPNTRPLLTPSRQRERRAMSFTPDAPHEWRVSFRCFSSMDRRRPRRPTPAPAGETPALHKRDRWHQDRWARPTFRSAWPLAERYEALIRVFNDPTAYARRLARKLHALPHRLREVLRADAETPHRIDRYDEFTHEAEHAWRPHFSSG